MKETRLVIVGGLSGAGKTTVIELMLKYFGSMFDRVITATTRPPRDGEVNGVDYIFLTVDEFSNGLEAGEFLEYATVYGHFYGVLYKSLQEACDRSYGKILLLNTDLQGFQTIKARKPKGVKIMGLLIAAPSSQILRQRLEERAKLDGTLETVVEERLRETVAFVQGCLWTYDKTVVNKNGGVGETVQLAIERIQDFYSHQTITKSVLDRV